MGAPAVLSFQFGLAPNPFRGAASVTIRFATASPVRAKVEVLDVTGRRVRTLADESIVGAVTLGWAGDDESGRPVPSGVYLFRVTSPAGAHAVRGMLLR